VEKGVPRAAQALALRAGQFVKYSGLGKMRRS